MLRPEITEPFVALSILNQDCKLGDYPRIVYPGMNLTLCIYVYNHKPYPILAQVRYKIGDASSLPSNTSPSFAQTIRIYQFVVNIENNVTRKVSIPITITSSQNKNATLIFELWIFDVDKRDWVYTGIWNSLHVQVVRAPIP
ncbi:hypothetical protein QPL79_00900 [Ignisphaera sp. 4213-co]|uniref:DUF1616 domain-containing protein n=1 Tax=Ignisphaera cupida TaxID=3050454 RepID=A0ABD4Z469_9CREN|nr:hypothetical protein [Ignisphaera sp. 4213-co]MDK6027924.1 hypothetical protein [Ignisphaera sp. 4213-co]